MPLVSIGRISTGLIADSAVTTAKIADLAVTTGKIAANAVDGSKIAMGSDAQGDILYYNGTDYVRLPAGTSGHFLKTNGAGANPAWAATVSGSMVFVNSGTFSGAATATLIDQSLAAYSHVIIYLDVKPASSGDVLVRLNDDATAADYVTRYWNGTTNTQNSAATGALLTSGATAWTGWLILTVARNQDNILVGKIDGKSRNTFEGDTFDMAAAAALAKVTLFSAVNLAGSFKWWGVTA